MMFHRTRIKDDCQPIVIDGNTLIYTKHTKFLGVIIDHKLNTISKSIGIINKTQNLLDKSTLRNLYFTFIYPYLIYCIEIWETQMTRIKIDNKNIFKRNADNIICTLP